MGVGIDGSEMGDWGGETGGGGGDGMGMGTSSSIRESSSELVGAEWNSE